jgi:hypothetical protein
MEFRKPHRNLSSQSHPYCSHVRPMRFDPLRSGSLSTEVRLTEVKTANFPDSSPDTFQVQLW